MFKNKVHLKLKISQQNIASPLLMSELNFIPHSMDTASSLSTVYDAFSTKLYHKYWHKAESKCDLMQPQGNKLV